MRSATRSSRRSASSDPWSSASSPGSVIIETIFGIPGLGKEFVESITAADYNITVAVFTVYALLIGIANLIVDLLYTVVDPRIRY